MKQLTMIINAFLLIVGLILSYASYADTSGNEVEIIRLSKTSGEDAKLIVADGDNVQVIKLKLEPNVEFGSPEFDEAVQNKLSELKSKSWNFQKSQ